MSGRATWNLRLARKQSEPRFEQVANSWIWPVYPSPGSWSSSLSSCTVRPARTLCLLRCQWLCGLGPLSGRCNTANSSTHRTRTSPLWAPPRVSSGVGPKACVESLCSSPHGGGGGVLGMGAVNPLLLTEWVMNLGLGVSWLGPGYALGPGLCKS